MKTNRVFAVVMAVFVLAAFAAPALAASNDRPVSISVCTYGYVQSLNPKTQRAVGLAYESRSTYHVHRPLHAIGRAHLHLRIHQLAFFVNHKVAAEDAHVLAPIHWSVVGCSALSGSVVMFQSNQVPVLSAWVLFRQIQERVFSIVQRLHP